MYASAFWRLSANRGQLAHQGRKCTGGDDHVTPDHNRHQPTGLRLARIHCLEAEIPLCRRDAVCCRYTLILHGQLIQITAPGALNAKAKNAATPRKMNATR